MRVDLVQVSRGDGVSRTHLHLPRKGFFPSAHEAQ